MDPDLCMSTVCPTTSGARLMSGALGEDRFSSLLFDQADAEIVEQTVSAESAGKLIRELAVPDKSHVALIVRSNHSIIPAPDVKLEKGDRVVAIVRPDFVAEYRKRFGGSLAKAG